MKGKGNPAPHSNAKAEEKPKPKKKRSWLKIAYSLFRPLLIPLLCIIALFVGLTIGYVHIGGGDSADVWQWSTWKHLYDLVFAE
jgi:hypothetical protein